jgi:mannose-6-phosphate isomerase-like protein (cupin superfamily)
VRFEERILFPLIEERAGDAGLAAIALHAEGRGLRAEEPVVAALERAEGRGVVWSASSADLNVNLVHWPAGEGVAVHVNSERDALFLVVAGTGEVVLDGHRHAVRAHSAVLAPAGSERSLTAGGDGIRYVSVHVRRSSGFSIG